MRMPLPKPLLLIVLLLGLAACQTEEEKNPLLALAPGWNTIRPGGQTTCADGSAFAFFVRPGSPDSLLFYLQGGGACWSGPTCDRHGRQVYTSAVDTARGVRPAGIFDVERADNPFAGYTMVYVPYCTGDVHLGRRAVTYDVPPHDSLGPHTVSVAHLGAANVRAALDWTRAHVRKPATVFVAGSSAGAIPSPLYAAHLADVYPGARVVQLGDAAGGYRGNQAASLARAEGTAVVRELAGDLGLPADSVTFEAFYAAAARRHPGLVLAQYNTAEDDVQRQFIALQGAPGVSLHTILQANYADIRAAVGPGRFFTYTAPGELHVILNRPEFYAYSVEGVSIRDWVARLAGGAPVEDVACTDCTRPPVASTP